MVTLSNTTYAYKLFGNVSVDNPSILFATSSPQNFSYKVKPSPWKVGTADDWGRWGHQALPRQLLMAPDSGYFYKPTYTVASGNATSLTEDATIGITIYQNSFGLVNGVVQAQRSPVSTINVLVAAGTTVNWQSVSSAQSNFFGGPGYTKQLQLSATVVLVFPLSSTPQVQLFQFEFQS